MKNIFAGKVLVLLAGLSAWASVVLFNGFSVEYISMFLLFVLLAETVDESIFLYILGFSLISILSTNLIYWAVLSAGLLVILVVTSSRVRYIAFVTIVVTIWFSSLLKMIPFVFLALFSVFIKQKQYKILFLFLALLLSVFWFGIPATPAESVVYASSIIKNGKITYQIPSLNLTSKTALLVAPCEGNWVIELALEAGGVRDTIPMYSLQLGEDMLFLPAGADTLCFTISPGDTVVINLIRKFHPFNHPVIHATAEGELL